MVLEMINSTYHITNSNSKINSKNITKKNKKKKKVMDYI